MIRRSKRHSTRNCADGDAGPGTALAGAGDTALCMRGISKRFGPVQALTDVTFTVRGATVHALCGENGAGKSTLMKILAGVYQPDSGTIELYGRRRRFATPAEAIEAGVAMIYQDLDLAEDLTVAENVFLGAEPRGRLPLTISRREAVAQTEAMAEQYGFPLDPRAPVASLPVGDCQVVEILKALRRKASIIVMDEPTSSLSEAEAKRLFGIVRQLRSRGISIVYISHRLEEIVGLADDISILRDGSVVHSSSAERLDIREIVRHMVGRELKDFFPERKVERGPVRAEVKNLSSDSGIRNVSFEVCSGEIVGMAGLVGAGRTQVARAMFGVDPKTSGVILLDGKVVEI
ncbi:MAG TPA: sugar ABC transporter ATP-binding protein, partial [Polyangia bacterium]|nr:sugar ABC transporter ATP-binding protein [Polyangia bacterium]